MGDDDRAPRRPSEPLAILLRCLLQQHRLYHVYSLCSREREKAVHMANKSHDVRILACVLQTTSTENTHPCVRDLEHS